MSHFIMLLCLFIPLLSVIVPPCTFRNLSVPFRTFQDLSEPFWTFWNLFELLGTFYNLSKPFWTFRNLSKPFITFLNLLVPFRNLQNIQMWHLSTNKLCPKLKRHLPKNQEFLNPKSLFKALKCHHNWQTRGKKRLH